MTTSVGPVLAAEGHAAASRPSVRAPALTWSIVPSPNASAFSDRLSAVSCASASFCAAVGGTANQTGNSRTLAETWNGTAWSRVPTPNRTRYDSLTGVSCVSASACVAVGQYGKGGSNPKTLVETWNGTAWSLEHSPSPARPGTNYLLSVSCSSIRACTAVGVYFPPGGVTRTRAFAESWNGTAWTVVPSPGQAGAAGSALDAVSRTSAAACTAVGTSGNAGTPVQTLAESWDGTAWTVVPSPDMGGSGDSNYLNGVSCSAATTCTAVGEYSPGTSGALSTLVESWNGTAWSVVTSPNKALDNNVLDGVSCPSAATCTAAGYYYRVRAAHTLVEAGT